MAAFQFSGRKLRELRIAAGIKPERIAIDIERSRATIDEYEFGRVDPPAKIVAALAAALGCRPGDLFEDVAAA